MVHALCSNVNVGNINGNGYNNCSGFDNIIILMIMVIVIMIVIIIIMINFFSNKRCPRISAAFQGKTSINAAFACSSNCISGPR